jgi:hypothetical protein
VVLNAIAPYTRIDVSWNLMENESAVTGRSIPWDGVNFIFSPQEDSTLVILAPTITSANGTSVVSGTGGTFQVAATVVAGSIAYSLSNAPAGVTINSTTGLITITGAVAANTYTFTINATNMSIITTQQAFTLTVLPPSGVIDPPTWLPPLPTNRFSDVSNDNWANRYVSWADRNDITTGSPSGSDTFRPDDNVTRAQFATFIHRVAGEPAASPSNFADSGTIPDWAATAVGWASSASVGVTTGFLNDNTYRPHSNITREQIATMLYRYAQNIGVSTTAPVPALNAFPDSGEVSDWATDAMRWAVHNELITGLNGNLAPQNNATRAQTVTMLYRFVENLNVPAP